MHVIPGQVLTKFVKGGFKVVGRYVPFPRPVLPRLLVLCLHIVLFLSWHLLEAGALRTSVGCVVSGFLFSLVLSWH